MSCMVLIIMAGTTAQGIIVPAAPMADFCLPGFADDGYKRWELRGREAVYIDENHIDIIDMRLRTFSDGYTLNVELKISSPQATLFHQERRIQSEGDLLIEHPKYRIEGKNWVWESQNNRFIIKENVRVSFDEGLPNLLAMRQE